MCIRDRTGTYIFLTFWALVVLFPFYWMLLTSVKSYGSYNACLLYTSSVSPPSVKIGSYRLMGFWMASRA